MIFHSSVYFCQALFKVNHFSFSNVLLSKCMCRFDLFSLPCAILLFPYILQRWGGAGGRKLKYLFLKFPLSSSTFMIQTPCFHLHIGIHFKDNFILVGLKVS